MGGKLGHKVTDNEKHPRLIEEFQTLNFQPKMIAAGPWHSAAVGADGRVCTWGWGNYGCLGHGDEECQYSPKVVSALANIKAVHVAMGHSCTFVVSDDGDVYSFGFGGLSCLGHKPEDDAEVSYHLTRPMPMSSSTISNVLNLSIISIDRKTVHKTS